MEVEPVEFFERGFKSMTGHVPFKWQKNLYQHFLKGDVPEYVDIPSGCGKTSIMAIWVLALAHQALNNQISLPRRLVWVVNRRVVVDQATEEAENIAKRITEAPDETLEIVRDALKSLSATSNGVIAVSTLRGELADNEKWKLDPSRPSIIVGTVDMIGSKLLFSGYGDGKWLRPLHAGLLGLDALIVHDEAHLTPAFQYLLKEVLNFNSQPLRPFFVMHLTATQRLKTEKKTFRLTENLFDERLERRLRAKKILRFHPCPKEKLVEKICEIALSYEGEGSRVIIYVFSPNTVKKIASTLYKRVEESRVCTLTGTIRGYERDQLAKDKVFLSFKPDAHERLEKTVYLVCTSAGEVGVDLDADHCVCDLVPIDSLIQRFGRVNRFGLGSAFIDMVFQEDLKGKEEKDRLYQSMIYTLEYLKKLPSRDGGYDVSPEIFRLNPPPPNAFSPEPRRPELTQACLDAWAMTSIEDEALPERPKVGLWLHGKEEEFPETHVVWRDDIKWLASNRIEEEDCERILRFYRVRAKERLRERTNEVKLFLEKLVERLEKETVPRVILMRSDSTVWRGDLRELLKKDRELEYGTIFLPSEIGGLDNKGMLDPGAKDQVTDVADVTGMKELNRARYHVKKEEAVWIIKRIGGKEEPIRIPVDKDWRAELKKRGFRMREVPIEEPDREPEEFLVYLVSSQSGLEDETQQASEDQWLDEHQEKVGRIASILAKKLGISERIAKAIELAGKKHDEGKNRQRWQEAIGNSSPRPLAKSKRRDFDWRAIRGYRHEFGSILDLKDTEVDELTLHLIAASHGFARPSFPERAYDYERHPEKWFECCEATNLRITQRFYSLQRKYGWWNLAFLESLLKCADRLVSEGIEVKP